MRQEQRSMFRQETISTDETVHDDRSMRVVEWILAVMAMAAAGVLAFIR
jgi:hypothetical protein